LTKNRPTATDQNFLITFFKYSLILDLSIGYSTLSHPYNCQSFNYQKLLICCTTKNLYTNVKLQIKNKYMPRIETTTLINAPIEICFNLARSVDLHKISTSKTKEYVVNGRKKGLIEIDEMITWRAKHFGVWQNLTSKITTLKYPTYFSDEMVKGTFQSFKHEHLFEVKGSQTVMTDIFDFQSPFGFIGEIFNRIILTNYMKKFLEERNHVIKEFAESGKWKQVLAV
jgi:ligand-binding SRPBCC domain-containing protein